MLELLIWILISSERYLELACATKAAGVAWVTSEVEITELTKPDLSNISVMFSTGFQLTTSPETGSLGWWSPSIFLHPQG